MGKNYRKASRELGACHATVSLASQARFGASVSIFQNALNVKLFKILAAHFWDVLKLYVNANISENNCRMTDEEAEKECFSNANEKVSFRVFRVWMAFRPGEEQEF